MKHHSKNFLRKMVCVCLKNFRIIKYFEYESVQHSNVSFRQQHVFESVSRKCSEEVGQTEGRAKEAVTRDSF